MKKIGIFYWPLKGNVATCAKKIEAEFGANQARLQSIDKANPEDLEGLDLIILGGSTSGADAWQQASANNPWFDFYANFEKKPLSGTPVAIFGLGDQILYPDHFVDNMKLIKEEMEKAGGSIVGRWPTEGYDFTGSEAVEGDKFVGLALDEDQQDDLTDERIRGWVNQIKKEAGI
ncbi:MAG TPA: flavodoxin [Bacteroidales bacterium]|nr:flavodoxin [Bacteroidales bacterium]